MYLDFNDSQWFNCGSLPNYDATSITILCGYKQKKAIPLPLQVMDMQWILIVGEKDLLWFKIEALPVPGPPGLWAFFIGVGAGITRIDGVTPIEGDTWYHGC